MTPLTAAITVVGSIIGAALMYLGGKYATRASIRANRDSDAAEWERRYRAGAEAHLDYDVTIRDTVLHLQAVVNGLRSQLGLPPEVWPVLPKAPPLFPQPPERKPS